MAVALQMLRRMHRRLTSAKPFLWDPTRAVPAARLARPCWHDLRVVFTARPWPWATTTHKADTHKLNTMHRLELLDQELARTWDKTLPCRLRRSSAARLSHGTDFRAGVATHNFHMADRHQWHTMCLPLRCWAKGRHSWHIVSPHCNVDKTHFCRCFAWLARLSGRGSPQPPLHGGYAHVAHHVPASAFFGKGLPQFTHFPLLLWLR